MLSSDIDVAIMYSFAWYKANDKNLKKQIYFSALTPHRQPEFLRRLSTCASGCFSKELYAKYERVSKLKKMTYATGTQPSNLV